MNTERPDNDDTAREPEDRDTPREPRAEETPPRDPAEAGTRDEQGGATAAETTTADGSATPAAGAEEPAAAAGPEEPDAGAEAEEPAAGAEEPATMAEAEKPSAGAEAEKSSASAEASAASADTEKPPTGAGTAKPAAGNTKASATGADTEKPPTGAGTEKPTGGNTKASPTGAGTEKPTGGNTKASATGAGTEKPTGGAEEAGAGGGAVTSDGGSGGELSRDGTGGHDDPSVGSRRRSSVLVASVAAAVLLVGGGGAYLAATAGGSGGGSDAGASSEDGTPPVLVLDDYAGSPSGGATNGIAPGEPNPYGVTYRADGTLPGAPGSAPVYWAKGEVTKDEVARLAAALGVGGTPVTEAQDWRVGSGKDGSGPVLRVNKQAPGLWTFSRYAPGPDACDSTTVCAQAPSVPVGDPVTEAAAKKAAAPVLKALGQDDAKIDASQVMGAQRVVNADPEVGGLPTHGWTTGVTVNAQGEVVGGGGQVKAPAKGDSYPVLGAQETLDRMNAGPGAVHRTDIGGCASPVPLEDRQTSPCGGSTDVPQKTTLTVEDAVFGLAPHASGGRQVLVPSWLFEVRGAAGGYTVTHPAVEPEYLSSPEASTPSAQPPSGGKTQTSDVKVDGYTAEGTELTVSFTGGVCATYTATAVESDDEVKVTVTETSDPDKVCILIAKFYHQTVRLDEPLGGRTVVGSDGREVPLEKPGARLP